jgi:hypothetical protein
VADDARARFQCQKTLTSRWTKAQRISNHPKPPCPPCETPSPAKLALEPVGAFRRTGSLPVRQLVYFGEDSRLRDQQNLTSSPAGLKIAVSLRRLGQRIRVFQPQLQRPLRNPLKYLTGSNV